jgi:DNA recombination protein RmuC
VPPGRVVDMNAWVWAVAGSAVGAAVTLVILRLLYAARSAALITERDLLRERVIDLEASLGEDLETASLLAPLREAMGRMEAKVGTLERDRVEQFGTIRSVLARVEDETASLGRQTASLAGSLNASATRGAWGEVQLRRVLEHAGMLERCDFDVQVAGRSRGDQGVRPDVVVRLPGKRLLIVDAKAPMTAFLQAQGEDLEPGERARLMREHARALSGHVSGLAAKDYWSAFPDSPEAVVCFVPSDAMLAAALSADPALHETAMARRVVLVGPAALFALLRAVAFAWQQDALTVNAVELLVAGRELHGRLATLGGHLAKLGRSLSGSVEAYNAFVGTLESRVLVSARRLGSLGLGGDTLPEHPPLSAGPRPLTAAELIDAISEPDRRPELVLDLGDVTGAAPRGADPRSGVDRAAG